MPTRYSRELQDALKTALQEAALTNADVSRRTHGRVSEGYFSRIRSTGYVPSQPVLAALCDALPELPRAQLMAAAGYAAPDTATVALDIAQLIREVAARLPDEASRLAEVAVRAYLLGKHGL